MTKVKESSTQNLNKHISEMICPITYAMNKISGHWKSIILFHLMSGPKRYSTLKRGIPMEHVRKGYRASKENLILFSIEFQIIQSR